MTDTSLQSISASAPDLTHEREESEELRQSLQHGFDKTFLHGDGVYDNVAVLILCWQEDDFQYHCADESKDVEELFAQDLRYQTEVFHIPHENSYNALEHCIADFKKRHDSPSALLIIYYSGHADPDERRGKAVWAAYESGEPTLDWFEIQPMLTKAQADVFLLFDCCHASLAAKARHTHNVELLAAAHSNGKTPPPGPISFTKHFVAETRKALKENGNVWVSEISGILKDVTEADPLYFALHRGERRGILLNPLVKDSWPQTEKLDSLVKSSRGLFNFTILVKDTPDKISIKRMQDWLCSSPPSNVSRVNVDRVIRKCVGLEDFVLARDAAGVKGRFLDTLPETDRNTVISALQDIDEVVQISQVIGSDSSNTHTRSETNVTAQAPDVLGKLFGWLELSVSKLSRTVWSIVANHPNFQSPQQLEQLERNNTAKEAGIDRAAELQMLAKDFKVRPEDQITYWLPGEIFFSPSNGQEFVFGKKGNKKVLVELCWPLAHEDSLSASRQQRVKKVASFLTSSTPGHFRIPQCLGFTTEHNEQKGWYGFVFELPQRYQWPESDFSPSKLSLRAQINSVRRVPREVRLELAYTAALALSGLRSVGWVHKGLRSSNMLFLDPKLNLATGQAIDLWLFGFENSRQDVEASDRRTEYRLDRNIYAPPSRWGTPEEKFTYKHDAYALGVILLEIGIWCSPRDLDDRLKSAAQPEEFQKIFLDSAGADLRHVMGTPYSNVVLSCLRGVTQNELNLDFQRDVVNVLESLCAREREATTFVL